MIERDELIKIGRFNKPHGVKGELSFTFTDDVFDRTDCPYIVCEIDGIFVPFFIEEYRFKSDTTGEKDFEEFYVPGEQLNMERFASLGVIENVQKRPMLELETFFNELESIFHEPGFTKAEVVTAIKRFLPNFEHVEKGKNLDQKM